MLLLAFVPYQENHCQKVFSEDFTFVQGGIDILKYDKISTRLLCFAFRIGGLGALYGGAKPTKAPRGDRYGYQQTSISKTVLPNHAKWDIGLFNVQQ